MTRINKSNERLERLQISRALTALETGATYVEQNNVWIPASQFRPGVTAGCSALTDIELTANGPQHAALDFSSASDEYAFTWYKMPPRWAAENTDLDTDRDILGWRVLWTVNSTSTGAVTWVINTASANDGDTLNPSLSTGHSVTDNGQGTAHKLLKTTITDGSPVIRREGGLFVMMRVQRLTAIANNLAADARFLGLELIYGADANTDGTFPQDYIEDYETY